MKQYHKIWAASLIVGLALILLGAVGLYLSDKAKQDLSTPTPVVFVPSSTPEPVHQVVYIFGEDLSLLESLCNDPLLGPSAVIYTSCGVGEVTVTSRQVSAQPTPTRRHIDDERPTPTIHIIPACLPENTHREPQPWSSWHRVGDNEERSRVVYIFEGEDILCGSDTEIEVRPVATANTPIPTVKPTDTPEPTRVVEPTVTPKPPKPTKTPKPDDDDNDHGNCGVGNGDDDDTPGCDDWHNDHEDEGHKPGNPGHRGGKKDKD